MKHRTFVGAVMACLLGLILAVPAPALATTGNQPQWSDFPELKQGLYTNSTLVRLWQLIAWSDIDTGNSCTQFVDGEFGPNTKSRTLTWQSTFKIKADGSVGPQTWGTAQGHLVYDRTAYIDGTTGGTGDKSYYWYYSYGGKRSSFPVTNGAVTHFESGTPTSTVYLPWKYAACNQGWTTVSW